MYANFARVIEALNKGGYAWRIEWNAKGENKVIIKQIPQCIGKDIVPIMTSLPETIKPMIGTIGNGEISYHDQVLQIVLTDDEKTPANATYYIPTWEDIFAEDWGVAIPAE